MIHQRWEGLRVKLQKLRFMRAEILRIREEMNGILAKHTGQSKEKIAQDTERDYYLTSEEAKAYGLIDEVVTRKAAAEEAK